MQVVGVAAAAVVAAPTLTLLLNAYGIGVPTEAHPAPLPAPQATLMASVNAGRAVSALPSLHWPWESIYPLSCRSRLRSAD
jgi:uncharacterized oligopeptide transporter (OPT) family protein